LNAKRRNTMIRKLAAAVACATLSFGATVYSNHMNTELAGDKPSIYSFTLKDIDGNDVTLSRYRGQVLLLVNVASKCGFTPQYEGLQRLYMKYKEQGLVVLGFPANNFMSQEPGTNEEIKAFCSLKYNVTFPMFAKISVKGADTHPLYKFLTDKETNPDLGGDIKWNFSKFLVNRKGEIIARFEPAVKPESEQVGQAIEKALQ
jgi:glutathione peroxidase